jgi:hypothetical protein
VRAAATRRERPSAGSTSRTVARFLFACSSARRRLTVFEA